LLNSKHRFSYPNKTLFNNKKIVFGYCYVTKKDKDSKDKKALCFLFILLNFHKFQILFITHHKSQ